MTDTPTQTYSCDVCAMRHFAEENPDTVKASFWRLHTRVCPMWSSYRSVSGAENPALTDRDKLYAVLAGIGLLAALRLLLGRRRQD